MIIKNVCNIDNKLMKNIIFTAVLLGVFLVAEAQTGKKVQTTTGLERMQVLHKKKDVKNKLFARADAYFKKTEGKQSLKNNPNKNNNLWNVQFTHEVQIGSGIETDGANFYVSQWNMDSIFVFDLNGNPSGKFKLPVTGIRDMAFDGTYFYGSNASNVIYKMNFTTHAVVDSIVCPAYITVRHIAYDNVNNAFWVGDWDTDIYLVNQSGTVINTISASDHDLYGIYGSAFDNTTSGGPYLWVFDQGGDGCDIVMIKISTGKQTGIIHNCVDDIGANLLEPIAGGLFIKSNLVSGEVTLGGIIQHQRIFGYDLSSVVATNDVGAEDVLSPVLSSGCSLGSSESITVRVRNYGLNSAGNFTLHMNLNGTDYYKTITSTLNSLNYADVTFSGTYNFSQPLMYKMEFNTTYTSDENSENDTAYYNIITGNGLITVDVMTDAYPSETYWELYNNYTYDLYGYTFYEMDSNTYYSTDICVDTNLCYGFTIYDEYGDGIYAPGYYEVFFNGVSVAYQDNFTSLFEEVPYIGHCDYADMGVTEVLSPVSSCNLGSEEFVTVVLKNYGTQTIDSAEVAYSVDGTTYVEPLPFSLASREEMEYTFINYCDLSVIGTHGLKVYTVLDTDMNEFNDTVNYKVEYYTPAIAPYYITFEDEEVNSQMQIEDENNDYFSWGIYDNSGIGNSNCALYSFNPNEPANDWLFTKCIELNTGQQYLLSFYCKAQSASYPEKLKVHLSAGPFSSATYSDPLVDLSNITDTAYTLVSVPFNVDDEGSGDYFIGFNVYSDMSGWNLYLDSISISHVLSIADLNNINDRFSVYPNPAANTITVSKIAGYSGSSETKVTICDIHGKLLLQQTFGSFKTDIDVQGLSEGMYILRIESDHTCYVQKFIKE